LLSPKEVAITLAPTIVGLPISDFWLSPINNTLSSSTVPPSGIFK